MPELAFTWWSWCIAGLLLLGLEIFLPGSFLMWFGLGALITAALTFVLDISAWEAQGLLFVVLSFICLFLGKRYIRKTVREEDTTLNKRLAQYVGRTARVAEAVTEGRGKVRLGDTLWIVRGPDMPVGTEVRITRVEGSDMFVEPLERTEKNAE